jgi:hypothetical protein
VLKKFIFALAQMQWHYHGLEAPLATGTVNMKPTPAELDMNLKANNVSIAEIARLAAAAGIALAPGTTVNGIVNADIYARGPVDKLALNGTVAGRDIQASGKDIPQPVQIKAVNLALTPDEIRSDNFPVISGGTTVNTQFSLRSYTSNTPLVDATLKAPQAELPAILAMRRSHEWPTTKFGLRCGAIGIRWRATWRKLPRAWVSVRRFVRCAKWWPS